MHHNIGVRCIIDGSVDRGKVVVLLTKVDEARIGINDGASGESCIILNVVSLEQRHAANLG